MTSQIYRDVILEQHVRLFRGARGAEFLFMDDNVRPHRANIVDECLQSEDITRMDWPAYSPDLNPIEHVWDMLGRRIDARQPPPTCLLELWRALLDEWCNIRQDQIDNLILSMPRRFCSLLQRHVREIVGVATPQGPIGPTRTIERRNPLSLQNNLLSEVILDGNSERGCGDSRNREPIISRSQTLNWIRAFLQRKTVKNKNLLLNLMFCLIHLESNAFWQKAV
ncbi:transposable element Tc3 transposase [Trichonephila clavipes]|uniref:Transposable element Tc3 transposase n=1 Tax=Trichonephila clavipes TaxID=2585209 RepID=A0A8X6WDE8_TRICX|nr:transposable element Tc3 transposase [Trichonephila clavipes]